METVKKLPKRFIRRKSKSTPKKTKIFRRNILNDDITNKELKAMRVSSISGDDTADPLMADQ